MGPGPSSEAPPPPAGEGPATLQRRLRELPELHLVGQFRSSSNATFLAWLGDHAPERDLLDRIADDPSWESLGGDGLLTVYKPRRGEAPLWDFPRGTLCLREVAAARLSRLLRWPLVPATVLRREGPLGAGSLQLFVDAQPGIRHLDDGVVEHDRWREVAAFDVLTNNADRKGGHTLLDRRGRLWVIDHGLTFHVDDKLRTILWEYAGEPLPDDLRPGLERVVRGLGQERLRRLLAPLLDPDELTMLELRAQDMLHPSWRFPTPHARWAVPWPPV